MDTEVVGEAEDGEQLLNLLDTLEPDIIISDISMPEKTGLDVLKEINKRKLKTKVIFLSGFQEFSYAKEAVTYGAVDYLLKPVSVEELEMQSTGQRIRLFRNSQRQSGRLNSKM